MTPKEKAQELINKLLLYSDDGNLKNKYWKIRNSKQCALIAVDEILNMYFSNHLEETFWKEVKQEIEKL